MNSDRFTIGAVLAVIALLVAAPLALRGQSPAADTASGPRLIVVTPHVQQIRDEFASAFARWHLREYGQPAGIDYRTPGGTSEIRRQLAAQYRAAIKAGGYDLAPDDEVVLPAGAVQYDLMFGGGTYDHGQLKRGVRVTVQDSEGAEFDLQMPMSVPAGLDQALLDEVFGDNAIGAGQIYDPDQHWIGVALSSFGIVYNRDVYARLGLPEPRSFKDLADPRLHGWVALADPRMSGSITTTLDSILGNFGWDQGWRLLRAMSGNARYFTNSATKPPTDVSQGEAAAGLAIDFYGRGQAQTVADAGDPDRVAYVDPPGEVYVDADPISILRGAPHPQLARRFVRFCLTEEAQALWQFDPTDQTRPTLPEGEPMGPARSALRRLPVRRDVYKNHFDRFMDKVEPFSLASRVANPGWRTGVQMMMGCFGIDAGEECRDAWGAIADAEREGRLTEEDAARLRGAFHSFPPTEITWVMGHPWFADLSEPAKAAIGDPWGLTLDGLRDRLATGDIQADQPALDELRAALDRPPVQLTFSEATYRTVRNEWRDPARETRLRIEYTRFFRGLYRRIVELAEAGSPIIPEARTHREIGCDAGPLPSAVPGGSP